MVFGQQTAIYAVEIGGRALRDRRQPAHDVESAELAGANQCVHARNESKNHQLAERFSTGCRERTLKITRRAPQPTMATAIGVKGGSCPSIPTKMRKACKSRHAYRAAGGSLMLRPSKSAT